MLICSFYLQNKRDLIVQEFYNSEKQYVESLQFMVEVIWRFLNILMLVG